MQSIQPQEHHSAGIYTIERAGVDAGNRTICSTTGAGLPCIMPSVHQELDQFTYEDALATLTSYRGTALIRYLSGPAAGKDACWIVGQTAASLGGTPTFQKEKSDLAGKLVLAAIVLPTGVRQAVIQELRLCTPNHRDSTKIQRMQDQLMGVHSFDHNGQPYTINVRSVKCEPETLGAFRYATANKLWKYPERPNAILDLGGGTSIGRVYSPAGLAWDDGRVIVPGTVQLARAIASDPVFTGLDFTPDLSLIMDGLSDGSRQYGSTGLNFESAFSKCRQQWLEDIKSQLKTGWTKYLPQLGEVGICGGSAPLAQPLVEVTKGRFKILDASTHSVLNTMGMML